MPTVIGLGELLWDEFPDGRRAGGAPANVAYHAGLLDADSLVATRLGDDQSGRDLFAEMEAAGLDTSLIQTDPQHPTGVVKVTLTDGQPEYEIAPAAWDHIEATDDLMAAAETADAVCFGSLAQREAKSRETIHRVLDAAETALKVYDVNLRQDFYSDEVLRRSLEKADVVKLNGDEVGVIAKALSLPEDPAAFAGELMKQFEVTCVCVTLGEDGCQLFEGDRSVRVERVEIELEDAVGAGDAFTAALIVTTLAGYDLEARGEIANAIGALVASRPGAMPDIRPELEVMFGEDDDVGLD